MATKTKNQSTNRRPKSKRKNRYCVGAKISEHKFLRILEGFTGDVPVKEMERTTHLSGETIRSTYRLLRAELIPAVKRAPDTFGQVGLLIFEDASFRPQCKEFMLELYRSRYFRQQKWRHGQRLRCELQKEHLLLETAVRVFCHLDLRGIDLTGDIAKNIVLLQLAEALMESQGRMNLTDLYNHVSGARPTAYPAKRFYEAYRRSLLSSPL